jgi:iron complex outermembrane recepter protein
MSFQRKKVAVALAWALGVGSAAVLLSGTAIAADEKITVTGSNIKRVEGEGALPVTTITKEDIEKSGASTPMELLQLISANNTLGGNSFATVIGATTFSAQTASLRGLGGAFTLVLINGHRVDGFSGEIQGVQGVNLATIPFAAIERVEVLKDGASAIYGSDAIGGVINFIMRQDYQGADATVWYGAPTRSGGGKQWKVDATLGWGDLAKDRFNAFASASYMEQKNLQQRDRNFSNTSYRPEIGLIGVSGNTFPGYISTGGIGSPTYPNCGQSGINDPAVLGNRCFFDPSSYPGVEMIPDEKLTNLFASGRFQINRDWQAYATGLYSRDEVNYRIQPVPISNQFNFGPNGDIPASVLLPPTSPFYPHDLAAAAGVDGQPLNVRYRAVENGLRDTTDTNENWQVVGGVKGSWMNWDWDGGFHYSEGTTKEKLNGGFPLYSQVLPLLNSGVVNLFGPNTPDVSALVKATNYIGPTLDGTSKNYGVQAKTSGEVFNLPAGPVQVAAGVEARRETFAQNPAPVLATGDLSGFGGNILPVSATRNVEALFAEVNVPILKTLEGDAAVRYDHYSDFGNTTNPKVSLRWQPNQSFLLRGSYGTGFVAPSLYQLFTPNINGVSQTGLSDPIRCPVTNDTGFDCNTQFQVLFGGNAHLKPQESEQASFGFVVDPFEGASVSVDYFKFNIKETIVNGVAPATILNDTASLAQFGSLVTRGPVDPNFPNLPGRIINIIQTYINLGNQHIQGIDVDARYKTPMTNYGKFTFNLSGTYYLLYDQQQTDGSYAGFVSNALGNATPGVIPRWKHYATVNWEYGPWGATLANTFQSSYTDAQTDLDNNQRTVGALSLWDVQGTYTGFKNWILTLGVKNVLDTNPPVSNQQTTFQLGFDPSYYDPRARFVYGSIKFSFK